ncbi:zinc finger protein 804A [Rhinoderma darwinii]|uniref:zinc finger protein 804A n=1 Tax=Rhinoderma darwinii TaxID=43563 RepID=UPI003F667FDD
MECYYIVISSSHLSNGHFRNVKGVFRGPLTSSTSLDLSEKENTRGNALESLKANFYCELCDKQYYKHQEFDNHINSYDHAHKQRLKELKQREFSRNVASKLRRNERKQKKYLQRLHKLAEHKRESTCAPGSGPMFKSTTVTVHDHIHRSLQSTLIHTAEREKPQLSSITNIHNSTNMASILLPTSESSQKDNKIQKDSEHKIHFSFSFPKKTPVKLEASAAVFYEFNEDISSGHGLKKRSRFLPRSFSVQSPMPVDTRSGLNDDDGESISSYEKPPSRRENAAQEADRKHMSVKEVTTCLTSDVCRFKVPLEFEVQAQHVNSDTLVPSKHNVGDYKTDHDKVDIGCLELKMPCSETTDSDIHVDQPVLDKAELRTSNKNLESATGSVSNLSVHEDEKMMQKNEEPNKRLNDAFHPVQNRDGSKVLQWPSEMIKYTYTQPSLSYSCNPLHFDFRSSKAIKLQDQPFCQDSTFSENDPNSMFKLNCETIISEDNNDTINTCHMAKASANLKCYSLICSIKEDQKHNISKYLLDNDFGFGNRKSNKKFHYASRKLKIPKYKVNEPKIRYRQKCHINENTQSGFKNLEQQHVGSKDSFCSLKNVTFSHQLPHAESDHTERELLKRPALKIKPQCKVWNVDQKRSFANQIENELSKNTRSFNYQSKVLQLEHCSQNLAYSNTFCSWSSNKKRSDHENHETFLNHSYTFKRTRRTVIEGKELSFKRPRLSRSVLASQTVFCPERNFSILCKPIHIKSAEGFDTKIDNTSRNKYYKLFKNNSTLHEADKFLNENYYKLAKESLRAKEFLKKIVKIKKVVENKLDQLCKNLLDFKHNNKAPLSSTIKDHSTEAEMLLPSVIDSKHKGDPLHLNSGLPQCQGQSAPRPRQNFNDIRKNEDKPGNRENQGMPMDEAHVTTKQYITEQLLSHVTIPYQQTPLPGAYSKKLKYHQCAWYSPALQPHPFPTRFKLIFPARTIQTCATVFPVPLETSLCSSSIAALPQHLTTTFPTASVDSVKLIGPPHQFLCPSTQGISRTPFYQMTMEPSLCTRDAFSSSPQVPIITNTVFCHIPVPLPQPSHTTVFTPIHSHLPTLIPLHSLF